MELPGQAPKSVENEKVLIWGAGGSVGGYAVQYTKSVGYTGMLLSPVNVLNANENSRRNRITSRF